MKQTDGIPRTAKQLDALGEIKRGLLEKFDIRAIVLYGSAARGQADEESDADLLVVTSQPLTRFERHQITDVVFDAKKLMNFLLKLRKTNNSKIKEQVVQIDSDIQILDKQIVEAEADMNSLTYRLYKLTDDEIKLVEGERSKA